jgi:hypothetical protein
MSSLLTSAAIPTEPDAPEIAAIRAELIGRRINITTAAAALGVTERSIYNAIDRYQIPFVKVFGQRYLSIDDIRSALTADQSRRGRGRPRKAA